MKFSLKFFILFLFLNFSALALGGYATNDAVRGAWYLSLNKAPWTPPGYFFGIAWTSIMICFSIFLGFCYPKIVEKKRFWILFGVQWFVNVLWNFVFFLGHYTFFGLIMIVFLEFLVWKIYQDYKTVDFKVNSLIFPYLIWLLVAFSLNLYIFLYN
ncbi:MAG: tryptophan-rich sensory protein [Chitinophagales bacterium]|jgi:tryptophan-rich sensory protein|nr:tryptophan-rich sensory protein [Chitinophagales bacterium]